MKRFRLGISLLVSLVSVASVFAQNYPMPSDKPVVCTTCVGEFQNLPTYPFSPPIKAHAGRIVDSQLVKDWQGALPGGIRTLRGRGMKIDTQGDRVYVMMGSVLASYRLSNFFTSTLKKPLATIGPFSARWDPVAVVYEQYLPWDLMLYPEDGTGEWITPTSDGQDRLFDYDFDDRGYVYAAYSVFGWGLVKENGGRFQLVKQLASHLDQTGGVIPKMILAVKGGNRYYALVAFSQGGKVAIFDTTNATSTGIAYIRTVDVPVFSWARTANGDVGITTDDRSLMIYSAEDLINGRGPKAVFGARANDISSDGISFWASEYTDGVAPTVIYQMAPNATGYSLTVHPTGIRFIPRGIEAGGNFVTLFGYETNGSPNVKVYRVTPNGLVGISLGNYFPYYYARPPAGYARPGGYTATIETSLVHSQGGKDYLFYLAEGLADVYELQTRDAVDIDLNPSASRGTPNNNTPNNTDGPFFGDLLTFRSSTTQGSVKRVRWDFANPESGTSNMTDVDTGIDVQHRYTNLTSSAAIATPKNVTAVEISDTTNSDSVVVNLKVPAPRVKVKGASFLITANATQNSIPIVPSDKFLDASDGTVEGHYSSWQFGTAAPMLAAPTEEQGVGACGAQTLAFTGNYAPYAGSGATVTPSTGYTPYAASLTYAYDVRPFVPSIQLVTTLPTATELVFQNTTRIADFSTTAHFSKGAATPVKIQWSITTATGTTNAPLRTTTLLAVATDAYTIPKSSITVGSKVTMTLTIVTPADVVADSCRTTAFTSASTEMLLNPPDPDVLTVSGCLYTNGPCSASVRSLSGASRSGWSYQWLVDDSQVLGATGETFSPIFTTPGNHAVKVRATNVIGTTTSVAVTYAITTPPCAGAPANITFAYSGTVSQCLANCPAGEPIKFTPRSFGYSFQECDTFKWEVLNDSRVFETREPTITFAQNGMYSVRLTVTNTSGSAFTTSQLQIGNVVEPPRCTPPPSRINVTFSGSPGCQVGGTCYEGDSILFTPVNGTLGNYNFLTCPDSFSWNLGNGVSAEMSPRRTFSAGTYTITLRVSNSGGGTDALPVTLVVLPQTPINQCPLPPSSYVSISWTGPVSNCAFGGASCRYGEQITFTASAFFPGFKGCETFTWSFGDGTLPGSGRIATHAYATTANAKNTVTLTIRNEAGEQIIKTAEMNLAGSPIAVPTNASFTVSGTPIAGKPVTLIGSATSSAPITAWEWDFGDGTPKGSGQSVTHTYENSGTPRVTLVARNEGGPSAPYSNTIEVKPKNQFAFFLPVVAHISGQFGSQWRTDLQIFNPDPGFVPASPMELTLEFRGTTGVTKEVPIDSATYIQEDLYRLFFPTGDGAGTVIVRGNAPYAPQMWTRTYNQSASGVGTFGQLIPAIRLTNFPNAVTDTSTYIMAGLENSARYRTNLGLANPTNEVQTVTVKAIDDSPFGFPLGSFTEQVNPYSLRQIGDLTTRIPILANGERFSLNLRTESGEPIVGYASMIDNRSGDPAYIPAIEADTLNGDYKVQLLPGVGRVGSWRSDVTIYNAGEATFLNLSYYSAAGAKVGEANAIPLASNAFIQINDLLHSTIWPSPIPDTVGALQVETSMSGIDEKYPVVFAQTYNDQEEKGTYGQGITAFAASQPNAKLGTVAYIPGIRSDLAYYTNLGLTNVTDKVTNVKVSLLDQSTGHPVGEWFYQLGPHQSLIDGGTPEKRGVVPRLSETASQGTLKIEVFGGGDVWAFASIVDRTTFDPEYVPAIPAPSN